MDSYKQRNQITHINLTPFGFFFCLFPDIIILKFQKITLNILVQKVNIFYIRINLS